MPTDPYAPGGIQSNGAHRARLEMMQQERIVDPNKRVKRFHWRAVMTPMLMKYWVPLAVVFGATLLMSNNLTMEAKLKRAQEIV